MRLRLSGLEMPDRQGSEVNASKLQASPTSWRHTGGFFIEKHRGKSAFDSGTGHTSVQVIQAGTMSVTWGGE